MLAVLREQNQDAFFGLLSQHLTELLPVIYTPTVGDACKQWSTLLQRPQGLYVSIKDKVIDGSQAMQPPSSGSFVAYTSCIRDAAAIIYTLAPHPRWSAAFTDMLAHRLQTVCILALCTSLQHEFA